MNEYISTLNDEQKTVVYASDNRILCLAGAGTGKTRCMIARITRLIEDGVDPSSILALTFTNAAALEMSNRFSTFVNTEVSPEFRTFHSFCYSLLVSNRSVLLKCGYTRVPDIATKEDEKLVKAKAQMQVGIKSKTLTKTESAILEKSIKRILKSENKITFDQICRCVTDLFVQDDSSIRYYKNKYRYIFVDEFQDTDPVQYEFIESFSESSIFVVADVQQSIYGFRGADSSITKRLSKDPDWKTYKLSHNYRSTKQICEYANEIISPYSEPAYRVSLVSERNGEDIEIVYYTDLDTVLESFVRNRERIQSQDAILVRTNREVEALTALLKSNGLKYTTNKSTVSEIENILLSVKSDSYAMNYLSSLLDSSRYIQYVRSSYLLQVYREYTLEDFMIDFGWDKSIDSAYRLIFNIRNIYLQSDTERAIPLICKQLGISLNVEITECDAIQYILDNFSDSISCEGVYVGTIHSVKGLEFDNVYVVGVGGSTFPITSEENHNLFYVAVTRAKHTLHVYMKEFNKIDKG